MSSKNKRSAEATERLKRVAELESLIEQQRMVCRALETDVSNPKRLRETIEWHRAQIAEHTRKIDAIEARLRDTRGMLQEADERLRSYTAELRAIRSHAKVAQLLKVHRALQELGMTPEELEAALAEEGAT